MTPASTKRTYRMTARADSAQATADRILDATSEVFWERPTESVSLDEIARRAGTTKQTVLRHFRSKDALFAAAVEREFTAVQAEREQEGSGDPGEVARVLVAHYERVGDGVLRLLTEAQRNSTLEEIAERGRAFHAEWCEREFETTLHELKGAARNRRLAQLIAVCDLYVWDLLKRRGLSRRQTETAMRELIEPLLAPSERNHS